MKKLMLLLWGAALLACSTPTEPELEYYVLEEGTIRVTVDAFDTYCHRRDSCPGPVDTSIFGDDTIIYSWYRVEGATVEITPFTHPDSAVICTVLTTDSLGSLWFTSARFAVPVFSDGTRGYKEAEVLISARDLRSQGQSLTRMADTTWIAVFLMSRW